MEGSTKKTLNYVAQRDLITGLLLIAEGLMIVAVFSNFLRKKFHFKFFPVLRIIVLLILYCIFSCSRNNYNPLSKISNNDVNSAILT